MISRSLFHIVALFVRWVPLSVGFRPCASFGRPGRRVEPRRADRAFVHAATTLTSPQPKARAGAAGARGTGRVGEQAAGHHHAAQGAVRRVRPDAQGLRPVRDAVLTQFCRGLNLNLDFWCFETFRCSRIPWGLLSVHLDVRYHMDQLKHLLLPSQITKMCIWSLQQADAFYEPADTASQVGRCSLSIES